MLFGGIDVSWPAGSETSAPADYAGTNRPIQCESEALDYSATEEDQLLLTVQQINARIGPTLMENRWSSDYSGGKDPASWTGSVAIFETYLRTGRPVKYGQCWVVSALVVTVCRALGIPCRPVTAYQCGHDMGDSFVLNLHKRFNKTGDIRSRYEGGSCWVYHAWNDVWMERRDLRFGLGGWQAIDATRRSFRNDILSRESGPASVEAIKTNQKVLQYDTIMGRLVVTKHPILLDDHGEQDLKDITNEYKHTEYRTRRLPNCVPVFKGRDVIFTLAPMRRTEFGQAFTVAVKIQNNCDEERYITCALSINSVFYNAVVASGIKSINQELVLKPNDVGEVKVEVSFDDYYKRTVDEDLIKITTLAIVGKTKQIWSEDYYFLLYEPSLIFEFSKHPVLNEATIMSVTFRNHLKVPITDGTFVVEGSGLLNPKTIRIGDVGPDEQVTMSEEITPMRPDYLNMFATFSSKELRGVVGSTTVKVNQREKWLTKFIKTLKHK
uniref:Transglutaminase-like domain-containing protein n=1 Tax=Timema genevievae TaxID=629358 RepID=A0A7R9JP31_TIMGE|nr:unnamed protein product [Timema genevievae]